MTKVRIIVSRMRAVFTKRRTDDELHDEIQAHLDLLIEEHVRRGMSRADARAAARREFGGVDQIKESYRDQRGLPFVESMVQDVRYALRILTKNVGSTTVVVLTLALGIGASAVMYSAIDVVLQSVPIADQSRVVYLSSIDPRGPGPGRSGVSAPDLADWSSQNTTFEELAAFTYDSMNLSGIDIPARVSVIRASANLLPQWGVKAALGRMFRPEEDRAGGERVVLLTDKFWRTQVAGDPAVLGRTVLLDRRSYTVVGVLPERMSKGILGRSDIWIPLALDAARARRDDRSLFVTGLLKPGVSRAQSAADIQTIARRMEIQYPATNTGISPLVHPAIETFGLGQTLRFILGLFAGVGAFLLLIACANVASIVLARATSRERELSLRAALGAGRLRLVKQLMVESFVWSSLACVVGVVLAALGVAAIRVVAGSDQPIFSEMTMNGRVLALAVAAASVAPCFFALLPAVRSSALDVRAGLMQEGRVMTEGRRGHRLRGLLVGCQVALAVVMLMEVGLLVRTVWFFRHLEHGFDPSNVLTLRLDVPTSKYAEPRQIRTFFDETLARIKQVPGVKLAGAISSLPISDDELVVRFGIEGRPVPAPGAEPSAARVAVSADYRKTMEIPLIGGRDFSVADAADRPPVALINELMAKRLWRDDNPIGKRIRFDANGSPWIEIVGVVGNVRNANLNLPPLSQVYVSAAQFPEPGMAVVLRTEGPRPADLAPAIRREVAALDKDQPIYDVKTMDRVLADDLSSASMLVGVLVAVALIAVGLAASGIYGVISYSVAQRTRELGIRMAFGAEPRALMRMVLAQSSVPVAVGGAVGLAGGVALARATAQPLAGFVIADGPALYIAVTLVLGLVALMASYVPARRALRVDSMAALRHQ
jgi:predicted permease